MSMNIYPATSPIAKNVENTEKIQTQRCKYRLLMFIDYSTVKLCIYAFLRLKVSLR